MKTINVVVANKSNDIISTNRNNVTLKATPVAPTPRLDSLADVNSAGEVTGAVPVYNSVTDKYEVQQLSLSDITGNLDGGTF